MWPEQVGVMEISAEVWQTVAGKTWALNTGDARIGCVGATFLEYLAQVRKTNKFYVRVSGTIRTSMQDI